MICVLRVRLSECLQNERVSFNWEERKSYILRREIVLYFVRLLKHLLKQIVRKLEGPFVVGGREGMGRRRR
jgi:hypothetical protein